MLRLVLRLLTSRGSVLFLVTLALQEQLNGQAGRRKAAEECELQFLARNAEPEGEPHPEDRNCPQEQNAAATHDHLQSLKKNADVRLG